MKYFTRALWLGGNRRSEAELKRNLQQWKTNSEKYLTQLKKLRLRLTKHTYDFFTKESLHDGRVLSFNVGDAIHHKIHGSKPFDINIHNPTVEIKVLGCNLDLQYTLKYEKVRRVLFDYPTEDPLFHREGGHIGDWGYDELTSAGKDYLRHEVLFASGTVVLIEFKHFSYKRERCKGSRYLDR